MQAIRTGKSYTSRSRTSVSTALVFVLTFCVSAMVARAQVPASGKLVVSQSTKLGALPGGGSQSGTVPAGDTMAVTSFGSVITTDTYGGDVALFSAAGVETTLGKYSNGNGVAVDAQNNLYIGASYSSQVVKIPYVSGAYVAIAATSGTTPNCTGTDTAECVMSELTTGGADVVSMIFDSHGNLFYATGNAAGNAGTNNTIFECTAACLYTGSPAPAVIFAEPVSSTPTTTGQLNVGGLALDASGNLFFTDSAVSSSTTQESFSSNVNELPYTAGTGYATAPTVIYSYTPSGTVGQYGPEIDGVAVDQNGTVYVLLQNTTGVLAFPKISGAYNNATSYLVSTQTGKLMTSDGQGNLYVADGSGNIYLVTVNNLVATPSVVSTPSTATNITTILNDGGCSPAPMVTFTSTGTNASQFSAATTGACAGTATGGASFATTLTFTPASVGTITATLTSIDTNTGTGSASVSGSGTGTVATPAFVLAGGTYTGAQSVTLTDATVGASIYYTTDGSQPSASSTLYSGAITVAASETINAIAMISGDTSSAVATATYIINQPPPTTTPTFSVPAGTYASAQAVSIYDSAAGTTIYYTTDGTLPSASSTLYTGPVTVASSETLQAVAVASGFSNSAAASAAYVINLPPSAFQKVVLSQATKLGALPGGGSQSGTEPAGDTMAVNAFGNVITTDTYGGDIELFSPTTGATKLGTYSNANGVAVDSHNNLYIGVSYNSQVIKVPYVNGTYVALAAPSGTTPACTGNDTAECVMNKLTTGGADVVSMLFDSKGNLFYATGNAAGGAGSNNTIFECTVACLYTGSPAPAVVYAEPVSTTPTTTGQLNVGGLAFDASGDLFFTDSAVSSSTTQESFNSNLNELVYTSGSGFSASPTVIYTYTPTSVGQYGPEIDGVAVDPNGTVYALVQSAVGVLAFPKVSGAYSSANMYVVSTQNGKLMTGDGLGNLFVADNSGNILKITLNNLVATATPSGTPSTATDITILMNDGGCSPAPTVTFAFTGTAASQFTAATTGTCASTATGSSLATTVTFSPTAVGTSTVTVTATDSLNNTATASVLGNGTGMVATPTFSVAAGTYTATQNVSLADTTAGATIYYTLDGTTPTSSSILYTGPISVSSSETINAIAVDSGDSSSTVASASYLINLPGGAATPTFSPAGGAYASAQGVTISDTTAGAAIHYTTDGSNPNANSALYLGPVPVSATQTLKAIAFATGFSSSAIGSALYTINLPASAFQNIVMSQSTPFGAFTSGGSQSGSEPAGDSMAVTQQGDVITTNTYGNQTLLFTPNGTAPTLLGTTSNPNGVAVDGQNNLFMSFSYNGSVVKIPSVNGVYATIGAPNGNPYPTGTPNCTGNDTAECVMNHVNPSGSDIESMVFDAAGDLFYATGRGLNTIYECTAACLYTGSPAPALLFTEPTSATPTTTGQLSIGGLAIGTLGNLFFTDSAISSTTSQESFSSNLNELVYTAGTGYAAAATVIYTYTPTTVGQYGPEIDGVAVTPNGTVYALLQSTTGILAFPKSSTGTYSSSTMYLVSSQSGKLMTSDGVGNLYIADNGGNIYEIAVDSITTPTAPQANAAAPTSITTYLNDGGCTATPPTVTFAATGPSASAFSAATNGSCTSTTTGASFATTVNFTPTSVGFNGATLTATDSLTHTGVAALSGTGTPAPFAATPAFSVAAGTYTTVQSVTISDTVATAKIYYTTDGSTPTTSSTLYSGPVTVNASETINAIASAVGYQNSSPGTVAYVINLPAAATPTLSVAAGTYTTPQTVAISDSNTGVAIYYTTDGTTPTVHSTPYTAPILLVQTTTITAIAFPSATSPNFVPSAAASAVYTINLPAAATPAFSVAAGTYVTVQTVSLSSATSGAKMYYTLNGSTPTSASTLYSAPILVAGSETIKALAVNSPNYNNSPVATAVYVINLPAPGISLTASNTTINVSNGTGTTTLTVTANAAMNGSVAFSCSGFLSVGATCAFSPTSVNTLAGATATSTLTVTVPQATASLRHDSGPMWPGTVVAAALLGFFGLRKRRRLQVLLLLVVSVIGLNVFTGCATTAPNTASASQIVVTATGSSCPVTALTCATNPQQGGPVATPVSATIALVLSLPQ